VEKKNKIKLKDRLGKRKNGGSRELMEEVRQIEEKQQENVELKGKN
jgi:hypothetical protein